MSPLLLFINEMNFNEMKMPAERLVRRSVSSFENGPDVSKQNMRNAQLAIYERNLLLLIPSLRVN